MLGSVITAVIFVGLLVTGIYATNVDDFSVPPGQAPIADEKLFADLDSVIVADKDKQLSEPATDVLPQNNEGAIRAFFESLKQKQRGVAIKPSSIFNTAATDTQEATTMSTGVNSVVGDTISKVASDETPSNGISNSAETGNGGSVDVSGNSGGSTNDVGSASDMGEGGDDSWDDFFGDPDGGYGYDDWSDLSE
jgi:hypothetical protein